MSKAKKQKNGNKHRALSAQQTIPYIAMHPDGICQLPGGLYTKTLEYEDINYAVASTEDQTAIISGWSACLNYFDSSLPFQLSFVNRRSRNANRYKVNIPAQEDDFNSIRGEYVEMLKGQIAKSNNGIERYKYITFGLPAEGATEARPRLGRVEADVMGKQNAARDRNYGEYAEIEKLLDKIRSTGRGGISADDDLAVEKLTKKLEGMESQQAMMKAVNAYYRKHKTLEGCPELTAEQVEKVTASMSQDWRKDPVPFPSYLLTNNNANIRRVRQRIEELSHKAEFVGWTFPSGEAKVNEAENRLQLIFADKPDADTRQALKSEGFKWAPSQGAWQRQLNQNAIRAAARLDFLRPEDGTNPCQLQSSVKRAEKDVSR